MVIINYIRRFRTRSVAVASPDRPFGFQDERWVIALSTEGNGNRNFHVPSLTSLFYFSVRPSLYSERVSEEFSVNEASQGVLM